MLFARLYVQADPMEEIPSKKRSASLDEDSKTLTNKKSKTSDSGFKEMKNPVSPDSVLNKRFFSLPDKEIQSSYQDAKPFNHVAIDNVINGDLFQEIKEFLPKADWIKKKNDLYTFNQTKDLASFSDVFYYPIIYFS